MYPATEKSLKAGSTPYRMLRPSCLEKLNGLILHHVESSCLQIRLHFIGICPAIRFRQHSKNKLVCEHTRGHGNGFGIVGCGFGTSHGEGKVEKKRHSDLTFK